jgi:hypothetical protein
VNTVPNDKPRRPRRKRNADIQVSSRYIWTDQDGVEHETDEAGLQAELRGLDGKPQPPANHLVWAEIFERFYHMLSSHYEKSGSSLSRDTYWWLWDNQRDAMLGVYRQWLGVKE